MRPYILGVYVAREFFKQRVKLLKDTKRPYYL